MDIKGSRDREKTHPSDGSFLGYHLGCVLMMEGGEEGLREYQVYFSLYAQLAGHHFCKLRDSNNVSKEN